MSSIRQAIDICIDCLSIDLIGPTTIVAQTSSRSSDIAFSQCHTLAIIEGFDGGDCVNIAFQEIRKTGKKATTVRRSDALPLALESFAGGFHRNIHVFRCSFVYSYNGLLIMRVNGFKSLAFDTFDKFIVDEAEVVLLEN
jgi:hypothetical protein